MFSIKKAGIFIISAAAAVSIAVTGCGDAQKKEERKTAVSAAVSSVNTNEEKIKAADEEKEKDVTAGTSEKSEKSSGEDIGEPVVEIQGLTFTGKTPLLYAKCFSIDNFEGGYALIDIPESGRYLVVPENAEIPEGLTQDITVLQKPLDRIYLAATSAMALFARTDSLENIKMTGTAEDGWYIDEAVQALKNGDMIYAGKYSEPDYETLVSQDCSLAIESTMIYHTPKVKEMIEDLGIPVLVDRSSYEEHPIGRTEWIKLYAVLTGKTEKAERFFDEQAKVIEDLKGFENTGKKVAVFYVNTDGSVVVRASKDYIPKMIEIAGAKYIFEGLEGDSTSISISMEEFYSKAADADYLIYNGSIDGNVSSIDDLIAKNSLFKDFKAVKEDNVWNTGKAFYQATDIVGQMIKDINIMITDGDPAQMTFLKKI